MPTVALPGKRFEDGYPVLDLFLDAGLVSSKSDARRLVQQGGATVGNTIWASEKQPVLSDSLDETGEVILRAGKKRFVRVTSV